MDDHAQVVRALHSAADAIGRVDALREVAHDPGIWPMTITGVGKSALIARRAAATARSLGLDAQAESATDLLHGGLGGLRGRALVVLSHSGETTELVDLANHHAVNVVITGDADSLLARVHARRVIAYGELVEPSSACGLPIAACYAQAAVLDVLTLTAARQREVTPEVVKSWHPGGAIGRIW